LVAHFTRVKDLMAAQEVGLVIFNDEKQIFERLVNFDLKGPLRTGYSHAFRHTDSGVDYIYFTTPYPTLRVKADYGYPVYLNDISALIAARANTDVAVKAIALWYRRPPHGVFVRSDSPIKTPKELEGKKLAISAGNSHQILWPVFEKLSGLKPSSVTWVTMDAASMPPSLIRGVTDAVPFFVVHEARIRKIAKQQNVDLRLLSAWADLGFDLSSTSLVAREDTIAKDPDGLKAFLRATLKGADYAFRNTHYDEGVGYLLKHHPEVDADGALGAAQVATRFVYAEEVTSGTVAVGQFEPARLEKTRDTYTQYLELKRKVAVDELYTNDLLPDRK